MKTDVNAGENSDINVVGSYISGKKSTALSAENAINLLAKEQHHQERSKNKSSGFNAGVAVSYGSNGFAFGITAGGNYGKGYGNGDETSWLASKVGSLQSQTSLSSQQETNIKGSQVLGNKINLKAQNLNIESLQDTMTYKGKQQNVSAQATVGYGASISGSYNQSKVNADYASVKTQAGLFAGNEGFDVEVKEHTDLKGAVITSNNQAEQQNKNRFSTGTLTYSDIENHSSHNASGFGISGSVAMNFETPLGDKGIAQSNKQAVNNKGEKLYTNSQGEQTTQAKGQDGKANKPILETGLDSLTGSVSAGFGSDKESQHSQTQSGIGAANIHIRDEKAQFEKTGKTVEQTLSEIKTDTTTETAESRSGKLENTFDKEKVLKELNIQVKATQDFDPIPNSV
ncbi:hemagglutinin/hemolysin-like protein [Canicola haemoglobinophilus]|uniref:Hemagglutinin/hemolysin-like protein n=1 Tax=Canicola haemoglobinophilus TaxID=733 RepID=A0AB38HAM0_9PAST|nr:hemagglutinin repeat-containing protein [Canicola haemoglobinophilus]STO55039.1 hemagglutinin/hemolysin-like protein [Canicola haemoglobinophilus]STO69390.1 hemagglutinin/hemolysin-like protein [Canicola haemoglobinophilus]